MLRVILVGLGCGVLFAVLDGLLNANPLAVRLNRAYQPIARPQVQMAKGLAIDLAYGLILAGLYLLLRPSLPGGAPWLQGLCFGAMLWLLRVVMQVASTWVMFTIPGRALLYTLAAGLAEMLALGLAYGLLLPAI